MLIQNYNEIRREEFFLNDSDNNWRLLEFSQVHLMKRVAKYPAGWTITKNLSSLDEPLCLGQWPSNAQSFVV